MATGMAMATANMEDMENPNQVAGLAGAVNQNPNQVAGVEKNLRDGLVLKEHDVQSLASQMRISNGG